MKTAKMKEFLGKTTIVITFIFMLSCSEYEINPECQASQEQCNNLLRQMEQTTDQADKEQLKQKYLSEKHFLETCLKNN